MPTETVLKPITHRSLSEQVRDRIIELIRSGLKPGDKLPSERELMEQLGVGRSSVREAMRALVEIGAVEMRPGSGAHVASRLPSNTLSALALALSLPEDPETQLLEARQVIEVACASLAAERANEQDLEAMEEELRRYEAAHARGDVAAAAAADVGFHRRIMEATRNPIFLHMIAPINELLSDIRTKSLTSLDIRVGSMEHHRALYQAIKEHDPAAARAVMRKHLLVLRRPGVDA